MPEGRRGRTMLPALHEAELSALVRRALQEDMGDGDVTSLWTVPEQAQTTADVVAKAPGVIAGLPVAREVFAAVDGRIRFEAQVSDGDPVAEGSPVAVLSGPARGILTGERTALNFLQRMSGIATQTAAYVRAVSGTGARILDTRKTAPGLRLLDKYAVAAGGGMNHRMGLYDMVLLKENHIRAAGGIERAVAAARAGQAGEGRRVAIEVEVETLEQLEEAILCRVDWIMLDNMGPAAMRKATERVRAMGARRPRLEASGNVSLETVRAVAQTGVDLISVGSLTHSVRALDLSLLFRADGGAHPGRTV